MVSCNVDDEGNFILMGGADAQIVQGLMAITAIAVKWDDSNVCDKK